MNKETANLMKKLGVPPHIRGYEYVGEAVEMIHADRSYLRHVNSKLYPTIAEKFGATFSMVERGIRYAAEISYDNLSYEKIEELFGNSIYPDRGKPTAKQFLATIVELMEE